MAARVVRFPNPVDEVSARLVAGGVVVLGITTLLTRQPWLVVVLAVGFVLRVLAGPRLSPLALLATRIVRPRLRLAPRWVAGPPKRFAQGVGATLTVAASVAALGFGATGVAWVLTALVVVAASLEAVVGFCLGCTIFGLAMRVGLVPEPICEACSNLDLRRQPA